MYRLNENIKPEELRKYGFKIGREWTDNERFICNDYDRDNFWLVPVNPDCPDEIYYADEEFDQPIWEIRVQYIGARYTPVPYYRLLIDCVPASTYHIGNMDMEQMFYVLYCMIKDGVIVDDYEVTKDGN